MTECAPPTEIPAPAPVSLSWIVLLVIETSPFPARMARPLSSPTLRTVVLFKATFPLLPKIALSDPTSPFLIVGLETERPPSEWFQ